MDMRKHLSGAQKPNGKVDAEGKKEEHKLDNPMAKAKSYW